MEAENSYVNFFQNYAVNWYHVYLLYPVMYSDDATISQHCYWTILRNNICAYIKIYKSCQKNKKKNKKYGHLTTKEAEDIPWDIILVDLMGPYFFLNSCFSDNFCKF